MPAVIGVEVIPGWTECSDAPSAGAVRRGQQRRGHRDEVGQEDRLVGQWGLAVGQLAGALREGSADQGERQVDALQPDGLRQRVERALQLADQPPVAGARETGVRPPGCGCRCGG
jgi:hypothetical protein